MNSDDSAAGHDIGRRTYLGTTAAALVGGGSLTGCLSSVMGGDSDDEYDDSDWPMFAGNVANTGSTAAAGPSSERERWHLETNPIVHTPAVADGVVYVVDSSFRVNDDESQNPTLSAYDAETGDHEWSYDLVARASGTPAVVDDIVYVAAPIEESDEITLRDDGHRLYAIDTDGTVEWTVDVDGSGTVAPTIVDGMIYVNTTTGTYAIDAETAEQEWEHEYRDSQYDFPHDAPAVVDGTVYASAEFRGAYTLDAETGDTDWQYEAEHDGSASLWAPTVADGSVYFGSGSAQDAIVSIGGTTGDFQWSESGTILTQSPVVADGTLYACFESSDAHSIDSYVVAIDIETGDEHWRFDTGEVGANVSVADETVYVRTLESAYALDGDGDPLWEYDLEFDAPWDEHESIDEPTPANTNWVTSAPAIADGAMFLGSIDGGLYAIGDD